MPLVTKLPVTFVLAYNYRNKGYQMVTMLILQTLRKIPMVTKLPGYQLHLYYPTCIQLLYKTMVNKWLLNYISTVFQVSMHDVQCHYVTNTESS